MKILIIAILLVSCSRDRTVVRNNRGVRTISTHLTLEDCAKMVEDPYEYEICVDKILAE